MQLIFDIDIFVSAKQMTRFIFTGLLAIFISNANGQASVTCNCGAIVDVKFKGKIVVYDKPNGQVIKNMRQDFKNEDFLILTIDKDSLDFFHVGIANALTSENVKTGWIKKSKEIGTFARNYQPNDTLFLYSKPDLKSRVHSIVPDWTNELYIITKCFKEWAYVRIKYKGQLKEGWLPPDKQCDNPYTTCN